MALCGAIEAARADVAKATRAYAKGGTPDRVNEANRRLADALNAEYENRAGVIPCGRDK